MDSLSSPLPVLSDAEVQALGGTGFFVRDAFFDEALAMRGREEAARLHASGKLEPAGVSRGASLTIDKQLRGDFRLWLEDARSGGALNELAQTLVSLGQSVSVAAYLALKRHDVQLAYYDAGAAYVRHRDAFVGGESRRLSVVSYLNPGWVPEHGGMLRVYPADGADSIDIAPVLGRVVVFLAETVEHEVLASFAPRFAVTAWFYAR